VPVEKSLKKGENQYKGDTKVEGMVVEFSLHAGVNDSRNGLQGTGGIGGS